METEYVALSMAMIDLLAYERFVQPIFTGVGLEKKKTINILFSVFSPSQARTIFNDTNIKKLCRKVPLY